ncbi:hypothetical protein [Christensenella timonensis]|uniref:hypothetical protein n=1 Tax=Christensenella timonensis TaxID=1816678 RepID=UPI000830405F|nr:hypothetical protein [Christensenella timonensis]
MAQKKKKRGWIAVVVIVAAILAGIALLYVNGVFGGEKSKAQRDLDAMMGQLSYKSDEDIDETLRQIVADGMFNISINSSPYFETGDAEGVLGIENIPANKYLMRVIITRDDTGDVVYESGVIEPGYYIEKTKLKTPLEKGVYPSTATFYAYDRETEQEVGSAGAKIVITVAG